MDESFSGIINATLTDSDFSRLGKLIYTECGIKMPPSKKIMIQARLQKRLRKLGIKSFEEYCDYLFSPTGMESELVHMIDMVTTNKTDFFREPQHFNYLVQKAIPELIISCRPGIRKKVVVWSAGCSTGEEPYTLAMVLSEFAEKCQEFQYIILATDISTKVLDKAKLGIYEKSRVDPVSIELKRKYLLRSKDKKRDFVRIVPELRSSVKFRRLNLMEDDFGFRELIDIIFCRNVIIYFDRSTQERLINKLCLYWLLEDISLWVTLRHCTAWTYHWLWWHQQFTGE